MRTAQIGVIVVTLVACDLCSRASADDKPPVPEELVALCNLGPEYATYKVSSHELPAGIKKVCLAVRGRVSDILNSVKGKAEGSFYESAGWSYIKSSATENDNQRIQARVTRELSALLRPNIEVQEGSPWRVVISYSGHPVRYAVSLGGGPYHPQADYTVKHFILNTETKELFYYRIRSYSASDTETVLKSLIESNAEEIGKALPTEKAKTPAEDKRR